MAMMHPIKRDSNRPIMDAAALCAELGKRGEVWADAAAAADALEEARKSVLAELKAGHMAGGKMSDAKAETLALGSPEYRSHLNAMVKARQAANRSRVRYDVYRTYVELERSNAATERALANL